MKSTQKNSQRKLPANPAEANRNRPEIRDNLDSRENLEQDVKGDDVTHNKKDHRTAPRGGKQKK